MLLALGAATLITYFIYDKLSNKPISGGLRRSHSVRRPNRRRRQEQPQMPIPDTATQEPSGDRTTEQPFNQESIYEIVYYIAEEVSQMEHVVHRNVTCGCCRQTIHGVRYKCVNCVDFDLCSNCEKNQPQIEGHTYAHIFYKIRVPCPYAALSRQPPIYHGGQWLPANSAGQAEQLRDVSNGLRVAPPKVLALWDQFRVMTTRPDGMSRDDFGQALRPSSLFRDPAIGSLVLDRLFYLFFTLVPDSKAVITFHRFVFGTISLQDRGKKRRWECLFSGYDLDGDGQVSRMDIIRLLQSHFSLEREAARALFTISEEQWEIPRSSRPLSSAVQMSFDRSQVRPESRNQMPIDHDDPSLSASCNPLNEADFEAILSQSVNATIEDIVAELMPEEPVDLPGFLRIMENPNAEVLECWLEHIKW